MSSVETLPLGSLTCNSLEEGEHAFSLLVSQPPSDPSPLSTPTKGLMGRTGDDPTCALLGMPPSGPVGTHFASQTSKGKGHPMSVILSSAVTAVSLLTFWFSSGGHCVPQIAEDKLSEFILTAYFRWKGHSHHTKNTIPSLLRLQPLTFLFSHCGYIWVRGLRLTTKPYFSMPF